MPEGDTLFKTREALRPDLEGQQLRRVELWGRRAPSLEHSVVAVKTVGKHLLIELSSGEMIRSHLGMDGTWHRYRPESRWRLSPQRASLALWTERLVLVCFDAKEVECLAVGPQTAHRSLGRLGPDLLGPEFGDADYELVLRRAEHFAHPDAPVADLLLDQRVACGVGNVFKNEVLFIQRIHPQQPAATVGREQWLELFRESRCQLLANVGPWHRTTTVDRRVEARPDHRVWVYGRRDEPCLRCGDRIVYDRIGFGRRSTYWCGNCQTLST